jgi:hypothetical protein
MYNELSYKVKYVLTYHYSYQKYHIRMSDPLYEYNTNCNLNPKPLIPKP